MLGMRRAEPFLLELQKWGDRFSGSKAWQPDTEIKQESNHSADLPQV